MYLFGDAWSWHTLDLKSFEHAVKLLLGHGNDVGMIVDIRSSCGSGGAKNDSPLLRLPWGLLWCNEHGGQWAVAKGWSVVVVVVVGLVLVDCGMK
jgi:hypothetical protein